MKLSQHQIQELYSFTRKHYVEHYDLQTELVDHLANGIEKQWEEAPELPFKNALKQEFKKFGVGGFEKIVRKRRRAMEWRYFKIVIRFYQEYFKLPRILMTALLTLSVYSALFRIPTLHRYDVIMVILLSIAALVLFISLKNRSNNELECVKHGKKWMLKDQIYNYAQYASFFNLFPIILNMPYFRKLIPIDSDYVIFAFAALIVCLGLMSFVTISVIPKKADELLAETYPEYKMVN